ncbi:MAG: phenylalanine--tRNA ligase beta subunit-related protein [Thalassobaculum sp.]
MGLRPISALVDITNYVTLRPRPAAARLRRRARCTATVTMRLATDRRDATSRLDGKEYTLEAGMLVIADDNGVEAIGRHHGRRAHPACDDATTDVFLEVALFDRDLASRPPAASSASCPTPATGSSAASIRNGPGGGPRWPPRMMLELCGGEAIETVDRRRNAATGSRDAAAAPGARRGPVRRRCARGRRAVRHPRPARLRRRADRARRISVTAAVLASATSRARPIWSRRSLRIYGYDKIPAGLRWRARRGRRPPA